MNLLILLALFVVVILLFIRLEERVAALTMGAAVLAVAIFFAVLSGLDRAWGLLAVGGLLISGAAIAFGTSGRNAARRRPVRVARTRTPAPTLPKAPTAFQATPEVRLGDYEVMERIGIGGMGSVYRGRRSSDGRVVALKVPQEKYLADAKFVKRFYREAEVLKRFSHPNIVKVYDYRAQGEYYIAMEYLDGQSLEAVLEETPLNFAQSVQVIRALSDALRHIHAQNVVHRDIKPANVMVLRGAFQSGVLREGGVKLMDFGIAVGKVLTRLTMTGARVGTPIYMAPEQAKGNRVDARSDVYSLGLLAYEMVTGATAFKGSYEAVVHQQVFEAPKPPRQVRLEVPGKLSDLILHMIEKDPAQRPTLDEVIARLDAGVLSDEIFSDPVALALSVQEKRGTLRLLDLKGKLRQSLRDLQGDAALPAAPNALAADAQGNLFSSMLEYRQGRSGGLIRKYSPAGEELASFGGYGLAEDELLQPVSLACCAGRVYVLDGESHYVSVFDDQGAFIRRFGGRGQGLGRFDTPRSIAATPQGDVYVLDSGNREVQRFDTDGKYVSRYAFRKDRQSEELRTLDGLSTDLQGSVYIMDAVAGKLRKIEPDGTAGLTFAVETLVGEPTAGPWLIQVAPDGVVFAVRQGGQVLRTYSAVGDLSQSTDMYAPVQAMALVQRGPPAAGNLYVTPNPGPSLSGVV